MRLSDRLGQHDAADLATGSLPRSPELLVDVIWILFITQFAVGRLIAPSRLGYARPDVPSGSSSER